MLAARAFIRAFPPIVFTSDNENVRSILIARATGMFLCRAGDNVQ
jgi:hypothetical protein